MQCLNLKRLWVVLCICLGGCAGLRTEAPPEWILSPQSLYPTEQFLTGMGEASKREQAERRAYAAVARIFSANVHAQSMDQESYAMQETGDTSQTQRSVQINQRTKVTTSKVLNNVKILEKLESAEKKIKELKLSNHILEN